MPHLSSGSLAKLVAAVAPAVSSVWTSPASLGDNPPAPCLVWDLLGTHTVYLEVKGYLPLIDEASRHLQLPKGIGPCRFFWLINKLKFSVKGKEANSPDQVWNLREVKALLAHPSSQETCPSLRWQAAPTGIHICILADELSQGLCDFMDDLWHKDGKYGTWALNGTSEPASGIFCLGRNLVRIVRILCQEWWGSSETEPQSEIPHTVFSLPCSMT